MSEGPRDACPEAKRRKVRKGTQSCWECKRRKVRCIASPENTSCNNCRRRGTACISQELPDTPGPRVGDQIDSRLGRVEELIEILAQNSGSNLAQRCTTENSASHETLTLQEYERRTQQRSLPPTSLTPNPQDESDDTQHEPPSGDFRAWERRCSGKYEEVTRQLIAAWPKQDDLDFICTLPGGPAMRLTGGILQSCSTTPGHLESLKEILQLPPPGSHPVLIARKLFMLGTFLHGVSPSKMQELGSRGALFSDIRSRVIDTAIRLVTTNDELTCSVEGIDCIMMESLYHNHVGNLHRAWMAVHRATAVAQMMAIHRGLESPSLKFIEPATRAAFNEGQICFRLVQMDRYLSLMLGLPPTSLEATFATPEALAGCNPTERLERIHCVVAENIQRRTEADVGDFTKTHQDDKLLQDAAADMPAQWWLTPTFIPSNNDVELLGDTVRLMNQFSHYHLLIRLHLPYMLRTSANHRCDHSRVTALNASREILSRYLAFRNSCPVHFYCRGDECLAFIAIVVLCIAHMNSRSRKQFQQPSEPRETDTVFNFLAHSRPSDRAMMERTTEIMTSTASRGLDGITSRLAQIIQHLLVIEENCASGTLYSTSSSKGSERELEFFGKLTDDGKALHIYIPYLGRINFERRAFPTSDRAEKSGGESSLPSSGCQFADQSENDFDITNSPLTGMPQFEQLPSPKSNESPEINGDFLRDQVYEPMDPSWVDDWDLQGIDIGLFDSLFRGTDVFNLDGQTWG